MARSEKFTAEQVIEAIRLSNGIISAAAKALGCNRATVAAYIERYPTIAAAHQEARETTLDIVENELMKQIKSGNITAIIFYLKTQGKHRGYVERQEHDVKADVVATTYEDAREELNSALHRLARAKRNRQHNENAIQ